MCWLIVFCWLWILQKLCLYSHNEEINDTNKRTIYHVLIYKNAVILCKGYARTFRNIGMVCQATIILCIVRSVLDDTRTRGRLDRSTIWSAVRCVTTVLRLFPGRPTLAVYIHELFDRNIWFGTAKCGIQIKSRLIEANESSPTEPRACIYILLCNMELFRWLSSFIAVF